MSHVFPTYSRLDIELISGKGTEVKDRNGRSYLDFISGIAVCNLGHSPSVVKEAVEKQMDELWHVSNLFPITKQEEAAALLTSASGLDAVFFCNSGAEANEAAIKLARKHTGKTKILTFKQSFHGRTFATMSATGQEKIHSGFGPLLPTFDYLPYNDEHTLSEVKDNDVAAIMLEVIQGEGGVNPGTLSFLQAVEAKCRELGALLIIDEVQTGAGRTGLPFAYQHYSLDPDIVTAAKGLGSGFPVGAMMGKEALIPSFSPGTHGSTFGGNPLAMAAAKATMETVFDEGFLKGVQHKSEYFMKELIVQLQGNQIVQEIKGIGFMIGISFDREVKDIINELRHNGLLTLPAGAHVIRLLPPLTVTYDELDQALHILISTIRQHAKPTKIF
ncbi:aspartate aminotransferase family protein [Bacillus sp. AFS015802]|uniref:acetylornithine transaminase n=1 Tax=Bacillus sp. AFS015802 TaxID=2033486 RepID=UPI000BF8612C|nr:acetylornithine transaminase [Bacillus sp. AFS015802]PFA68457.1 aspartate aminotransferase family protein [Bacillus sp. AFS015802]